MTRKSNLKFDQKAWNAMAKEVIETEGVARMKRVADAANAHLDRPGYMVSVDGDDPLEKHDYRATVITATEDAMYDNAKHNRLVTEFHKAGGQ